MADVIAALDNPALIPPPQTAADPNATLIGGRLPDAAMTVVSAPEDASPFGNKATQPTPLPEAAAPAKKSLILPIAIAVMIATSAVAYFSGAFAPPRVEIVETPPPDARDTRTCRAARADQPCPGFARTSVPCRPDRAAGCIRRIAARCA